MGLASALATRCPLIFLCSMALRSAVHAWKVVGGADEQRFLSAVRRESRLLAGEGRSVAAFRSRKGSVGQFRSSSFLGIVVANAMMPMHKIAGTAIA
jgi:hypothetical protein